MKFLSFATLLATASAFTTSPVAFSNVGEKALLNTVAAPDTHRTRRATIVMDGKANGEYRPLRGLSRALGHLRTTNITSRRTTYETSTEEKPT